MIVMSRHKGESIQIGDDIVITVVEIRGDKVRLGIEYPPEVPVQRQEVYEVLQREKLQAQAQAAAPSAPTLSSPHFANSPAARLDKFVAILEVRLGVPITRAVIVQAMREAGLELAEEKAGAR